MERRGGTASDFLSAVFPSIDGKTGLLPNPGPESVAGLHPDLVLMKGSQSEPLAEALAKVGIPTAYLNLETPEDYERDIANLGVILGNPKRAGEIVAYYGDRVARVEKALAGLREEEKPSVLVVMGNLRNGKYAVRVPALAWMQTYQVKAAGGRPVWLEAAEQGGGWAVVNLEQIAAWNPDRIDRHRLALDGRLGLPAPGWDSDPQWKLIGAVAGGQVNYFPSDFYGWDVPDARWILGLTWMAATLHPGAAQGLRSRNEVYRFYQTLYGLDRETIRTQILLMVKTDFR